MIKKKKDTVRLAILSIKQRTKDGPLLGGVNPRVSVALGWWVEQDLMAEAS